MREKYKQNILYLVIVLVFAVFILVLRFRNQLELYIHPRYIMFSVISSVLVIITSVSGIYIYVTKLFKNKTDNKEEHYSHFNFRSVIILIIVLLTCLLIPAKSLTSATASQRNIDISSIENNDEQSFKTDTFNSFNVDTEKYSIGDWISLTRATSDLTFFKDKKVIVSGFIFHESDLPKNIFSVSRFVVTCCAVDARPVGLYVNKDLSDTDLKENDWIEVKGVFNLQSVNGKDELVIIPNSLEKIEKPKEQYLF